MGPWAKEGRWPLAARKGKDKDSPLEPSKGMQPCWHRDISHNRLILVFICFSFCSRNSASNGYIHEFIPLIISFLSAPN